uniref:DUF6531 domain-containing protein n=1 Tax=Kiloniella litopenaei TaxID=1549748 RepID=UPI003BA9DCAF
MRFVIGYLQALCFAFVLGSVFAPSGVTAAEDTGWKGKAAYFPTSREACEDIRSGYEYLYVTYVFTATGVNGSGDPTAACYYRYFCCGPEESRPLYPMRTTFFGPECTSGIWENRNGVLFCAEEKDELGDRQCNAKAGNPITLPTGNKFQSFTDFTTNVPSPLSFTRYYNSKGDNKANMGDGWSHNFAHRLEGIPHNTSTMANNPEGLTAMVVRRPDGQALRFERTSGTTFVPDSDQTLKLERVGTEWQVTTLSGRVEVYSGQGKLQSITDKSGYQILTTYANNLLSSVSDSYGRSITLTYGAFNRIVTVKAPDDKEYKYRYTSSGVGPLAKVIYPKAEDNITNPLYSYPDTSVSETYHYEDSRYPAALTGITDRKGVRFATWEYDDQLRATRSYHAGNAEDTQVAYDDANQLITVTNSLGKETKYHWSNVTGGRKITRVEGVASANCLPDDSYITYDANGFMASSTDKKGYVTNYTRNARGLPETVTRAAGLPEEYATTTTWHADFAKPTQVVSPGLTIDFTYDAAGNLLSRTETDTTSHTVPYSTQGETRTTSYSYSNTGQLLSVDGPLSGTDDLTSYTYNLEGYLSKVTNALGHVSEITSLDANGRPLVATSINGEEARYAYDIWGRLISTEVGPEGSASITRLDYDDRDLVTRIIWPDGSEESYVYNDARYLTEVSRVTGEKITYSYDAMGNRTSTEVHDPAGVLKNNYSQNFDEMGRLIKFVGANAQETVFAYDKNDNVVSITDPRSKVTQNSFDGLNRLVSETNALNDQATVSYNDAGDLDGFTDQRNNTTSYVHNGFGDVIQRVSPDSGATTYAYDVAGRLSSKTDARGVEVTYSYDLLDRVVTRSYPSTANETVTYGYDDVTNGNKGLGRLTSVTDDAGSVSYRYDARGNLLSETRVMEGNSYTTGYGYDIADNLISITYPSGRIVTYQRDGQGRVETVLTQKTALSAPQILADGLRYEAYGPLSGFRQGNGMETSLSYDGDYRLTGISAQKNGISLHNLSFAYDPAGNVTAETDGLDNSLSQSYGYDDINRLTSATGIYGSNDYSYDAVGNLLSRVRNNGGSLMTDTMSYAPTSNRLLSASISDGTQTLESA